MTGFEPHRARLFGIAYRMLGSAAEAEDIVQETYLRYCRTDPSTVDNPAAFLTTVVARLCIDQLKSARVQRTEYPGPWLPEPVVTEAHADPHSISLAFLSLLERLSAPERAVYVLHEVFDYAFAEVAEITRKSEANCRQIFRRAKAHLREGRPRFESPADRHLAMVGAFLSACATGEVGPIERLLAEDAIMWSDGGGRVQALSRPLEGARPIARFFAGLAGRRPARARVEIQQVNAEPAAVVFDGEVVVAIFCLETDGFRIHGIRAMRNPVKLARFGTIRATV